MGRLDGKVALITGAASGMGKVAATLLAREGASVVVADVTDEAGQAAVKEIGGAGGSAAYFHADVSSQHRRRSHGPIHRRAFRRAPRPLQQRGDLPGQRRLGDRHAGGHLGPGHEHQPQGRVPRMQVRHTGDARLRRRLDHQRRIVRCSDGRGHSPDRLHGQQGRGPVDDQGDRDRVRPKRTSEPTRCVPVLSRHPCSPN